MFIYCKHLSGGRSSVGRAPDCDSGCRGFKSHRPPHFFAGVVELVDTLDLGSSASRRESSSLSFRTISSSFFQKLFSTSIVGEWRSLVAHLFWVQGVAGSNPVSPTTALFPFFYHF